MRFGRFSAITCVARMCASSVVPQPKASAPSPPTVLAWLSGTAWVAPGSTMPSSGATTCEMPCSGIVDVEQPDAVACGCPRASP